MSYSEPAYVQAQAEGYGRQSLGAEVIRDASLRNKADETHGYLRQAHNLLDELEDALHGPSPRKGESTANGPAPGHPGLRVTLGDTSAAAATLVGRLSTLLGSL